jgi:hypothetical protein
MFNSLTDRKLLGPSALPIAATEAKILFDLQRRHQPLGEKRLVVLCHEGLRFGFAVFADELNHAVLTILGLLGETDGIVVGGKSIGDSPHQGDEIDLLLVHGQRLPKIRDRLQRCLGQFQLARQGFDTLSKGSFLNSLMNRCTRKVLTFE